MDTGHFSGLYGGGVRLQSRKENANHAPNHAPLARLLAKGASPPSPFPGIWAQRGGTRSSSPFQRFFSTGSFPRFPDFPALFFSSTRNLFDGPRKGAVRCKGQASGPLPPGPADAEANPANPGSCPTFTQVIDGVPQQVWEPQQAPNKRLMGGIEAPTPDNRPESYGYRNSSKPLFRRNISARF